MGQHGALLQGKHMKGVFPADPESWIRLSEMDSGVTGMAFLFGELHMLGQASQRRQIASMSFNGMTPESCGVDHDHSEDMLDPQGVVHPAMAGAYSGLYDTVCEDDVSGACLMLELELAFDHEFQSLYPDSFQDEAAALINMVEGYYHSQFGVLLDTLSVTFLDPGQLAISTDVEESLKAAKKARTDGDLPFLVSDTSLFHLVSGVVFDDDYLGMAFVESLCNPFDNAVAVSSLYSSMPSTALVVAHELGHNLGAGHDDVDNFCDTGDIMTRIIPENASGFSSCSYDEITQTIGRQERLEQCFNFPADVTLTLTDERSRFTPWNEPFQADFDVVYQQAYAAADSVELEGRIVEGEGQLTSVALDGSPCEVSESASEFQCEALAPDIGGHRLTVDAIGTGSHLGLEKQVSLGSVSGEVKDINRANDTVLTIFELTLPYGNAPDDLKVSMDSRGVGLEWINSSELDGTIFIERKLEGAESFSVLVDGLEPDTDAYLDSSAVFGQSYYYRVRVYADGRASRPSNTVSAWYEPLPESPQGLKATQQGASIMLEWSDMSDLEDGFNLERRRLYHTDWTVIAKLGADLETYTDTTPVAGFEYVYRVIPFNSRGTASGPSITVEVMAPVREGPDSGSGSDQEERRRAGDTASGSSGGGGSIGWPWLLLAIPVLLRRFSAA